MALAVHVQLFHAKYCCQRLPGPPSACEHMLHYYFHLATACCKLEPKQVGAKMVQLGPPGAKKLFFSNLLPDQVECQNKCF